MKQPKRFTCFNFSTKLIRKNSLKRKKNMKSSNIIKLYFILVKKINNVNLN